MKFIFDLDDFCDEHNVLPRLIELREILPNLKVNLFTIPKRISFELLKQAVEHKSWIKLIVHGYTHDNNYEFAKKDYNEAKTLLTLLPYAGFYDKGFKAPGWQISPETMQVLKDLGFYVAVQWSDGRFNGDVNGPYQPKVIDGLKFYAINELKPGYRAIHGHTWDCCGNGLEQLWPQLANLPPETEFVFINDYLNEDTGNRE